MMEAIGNKQSKFSFSRAEAALVNFEVIAHIVVFLPFFIFAIYTCVFHREAYLQILPNALVLFLIILSAIMLCMSCVYLCRRWQLFKYSETVSLSIDVGQQTVIYKQNDKVIEFGSGDIENWYSSEYKADPFNVLVEIVEIKLKTGERIIVSNGIGPVADFFRAKWKELGMPKGERGSKPLVSYMKEIEMQQ